MPKRFRNHLSNSSRTSHIFRFHDWLVTHKFAFQVRVTRGWVSFIQISCPIGVRVSFRMKTSSSIAQLVIHGPFQVYHNLWTRIGLWSQPSKHMSSLVHNTAYIRLFIMLEYETLFMRCTSDSFIGHIYVLRWCPFHHKGIHRFAVSQIESF